jgi:hypothetical protein
VTHEPGLGRATRAPFGCWGKWRPGDTQQVRTRKPSQACNASQREVAAGVGVPVGKLLPLSALMLLTSMAWMRRDSSGLQCAQGTLVSMHAFKQTAINKPTAGSVRGRRSCKLPSQAAKDLGQASLA